METPETHTSGSGELESSCNGDALSTMTLHNALVGSRRPVVDSVSSILVTILIIPVIYG